MALSATAVFGLTAALTKEIDLSTASTPLNYRKSIQFADGGGLNQALYLFSDQRTLASSGAEDLDLAGTLVDIYGASITFASIKLMAFHVPASAGAGISVTAKATNGFVTWVGAAGDAIKVLPGGLAVFIAPAATGYAVTAGTGDLITVTNLDGAAGVTYDVILMGD